MLIGTKAEKDKEELFPLSDEDDVLARGGFLPETSSNRQGG